MLCIYSKNNGRITVSPSTWAFQNNEYKYGNKEYRVSNDFFMENTNSEPKAAGS